MATGILGTAALAATTSTSLYTVPVGKVATMSVNFCNRGSTPVTVRLSISASGSPSTDEYFLYDYTVAANSSLERSGLIANAGKIVVVYASSANVSCQAYGFEE